MSLLLLVSVAMLAGPGVAQEVPGTELRSLGELLQRGDELDLEVAIRFVLPDSERGKQILAASGERVEVVNFPRVVEAADGSRSLLEWQCSTEALAALYDAEQAFGQSDWAGARVGYRKVVRIDPDCYMAHAHLGDTFFREDNFSASIPHYSRAIEINPDDHRTWVYRGHALLRVGQGDQALSDFQQALALRPHYWLVEQIVAHYQDFGVVLNDLRVLFPVQVEVLRPLDASTAAAARSGSKKEKNKSGGKKTRGKEQTSLEPKMEDPDVEIFVISPASSEQDPASDTDDVERPRVMTMFTSYGLCQAIWEIESGVDRKTATASGTEAPPSFDARREQECLAVALDSYETALEPEGADDETVDPAVAGSRDPTLDLLLQIRDQGFLADAVLYGIGGPRFAHIPILMGDDVVTSQRRFVERFVLLRRQGGK